MDRFSFGLPPGEASDAGAHADLGLSGREDCQRWVTGGGLLLSGWVDGSSRSPAGAGVGRAGSSDPTGATPGGKATRLWLEPCVSQNACRHTSLPEQFVVFLLLSQPCSRYRHVATTFDLPLKMAAATPGRRATLPGTRGGPGMRQSRRIRALKTAKWIRTFRIDLRRQMRETRV
jgi:hypothetical protein